MGDNDLRYLLVSLPLTDPTSPYHSISYLVGAATAAGYTDFSCLDTNIESLNYLARPDQVATLIDECARHRAELEAKDRLTRGEQMRYRYALKGLLLAPETVSRAIQVMTDPDQFYDYSVYREAVVALRRWLDALSVRGFPGQFRDFNLMPSAFGSFSSITDLTNGTFVDRLTNPFAPYFRGPFSDRLTEFAPRLVGLSVTYTSQLPFAIMLSRLVRTVLPDCVLCLGGTEISDLVKYLRDPQDVWRLFPDADAIVVGEGESAFVDILDAVSEDRPIPGARPGILSRQETIPGLRPIVRYENLAALSAPRYDVWKLDQYWAPEPVLLFAPTRGCYWNKCTFCDYGLNTDFPTSPSRNRPIEAAIAELRSIRKLARTVYFSVDAIAPAYLRRLAQAIAADGLDIQWAAELRLDRTFLRDMVNDLRASGCVAASFGYESGTQRILDLINKGVRLTDVPELLHQLAQAGIGAQMMGFIGFPGETEQEASETFNFLLEHRDGWTLAGIGDFVLTGGSIVAQRFGSFGIQELRPLEGDDILRSLGWIDTQGKLHVPGDNRSPSVSALAAQVSPLIDDRPFVGGIDSTHSMLYFGHFGPQLVPTDLGMASTADPILRTMMYQSPLRGVDSFVSRADLDAYLRERVDRGLAVQFNDVQAWLGEYPELATLMESESGPLEIYPNGHVVTLTEERFAFEQDASPAYRLAKALLVEGKW
jgi:anaerobic magnesium-protoporphyrin IX monomethyl ester cyclase